MLSKFKSNMTAPIMVALVYLLLLLSKIIKITESGENEYISVIVLQLLIFLLPSVIYTKLKGDRYALRLRINLIGAQQIVVSILAALTLICGSLLINILFADGLGSDEFSLYNTFVAFHDGSAASFLYATVAYAALPAVCEEFFFRSLLCAEYEEYGVFTACLMSSVFFGMIHFNPKQFLIYLFAGLVLFASMYATRSVIGSILVHFLYNMYGLFGQSFAGEVYRTTGSTELFLLILSGAFVLFGALFFGEAARLYRRYARQNKPSDYVIIAKKVRNNSREKSSAALAETFFAPPCLACYLIFIFAVILL